eukprot:886709-Pleurochrysis_carterae.AAC.1
MQTLVFPHLVGVYLTPDLRSTHSKFLHDSAAMQTDLPLILASGPVGSSPSMPLRFSETEPCYVWQCQDPAGAACSPCWSHYRY